VACPATSRYGTVFLPYSDNLQNLRNATARSLVPGPGRISGIVNTVWCPWRYLPGAVDFAMALGAHLMTAPVEDEGLAGRFASRFYGMRNGSGVGAALLEAHNSGLNQRLLQRLANGCDGNGNKFSREDRRVCAQMAEKMAAVLEKLRSRRSSVTRNADRFGDLLISVEALCLLGLYGSQERRRGVPGAKGLYCRIERAWKRDRYPGDPMRFAKKRSRSTQSMLAIIKAIS
jgi:hypothetical protein